MHTHWCRPKAGQRQQIGDRASGCRLSHNQPREHPAQAEGTLQPRLLYVTAWQRSYGCHHQEGSSEVGHRGDSVLGQHLSRAVVATAGAYSSSTSEAAQASDSYQPTTPHSPIHTKTPCRAPCPAVWPQNKAGVSEAGGVIGYEGQRGLDSRLQFSGVR